MPPGFLPQIFSGKSYCDFSRNLSKDSFTNFSKNPSREFLKRFFKQFFLLFHQRFLLEFRLLQIFLLGNINRDSSKERYKDFLNQTNLFKDYFRCSSRNSTMDASKNTCRDSPTQFSRDSSRNYSGDFFQDFVRDRDRDFTGNSSCGSSRNFSWKSTFRDSISNFKFLKGFLLSFFQKLYQGYLQALMQ